MSVIKKINFTLIEWVAIISFIMALFTLSYEIAFTKEYKYTETSESIFLNKQERKATFIDKLKPLIDQVYFSKQRFILAIDSCLNGERTKPELLNAILKLSYKGIVLKKNEPWWHYAPIVILLCIIVFLIYKFNAKNFTIKKEGEKLKEEAKSLKKRCEEEIKNNEELRNNNEKLLLQCNDYEDFKQNLSMCNVDGALITLKKSNWSSKGIREKVRQLHEFHMIGIFAEKWFSVEKNLPEFVEFMDLYKNSDYRSTENDKIWFLLSNPLNSSVCKKLKKSDTRITDETIAACFDNYSELYKIYDEYDNFFECRIMDDFPIFRYRRINGKILVADYSLREDADGDHRPHLLLKNEDGFERDGEQIPANQFYDAFTKYFKECWESAQSFPNYMNNNKK